MRIPRALPRARTHRPYFPPKEIHSICLEALESVGLLPERPAPVRIERFIEKKFGTVPDYKELPEGVLGFSRFRNGRVVAVVVSRSLDDERTPVASRRVRTTLAHEAGHGLLHACLFDAENTNLRLFEDQIEDNRPKILCRNVGPDSSGRYRGEWAEYQANQAIGGLLLPQPLVELAVEPFLETTMLGVRVLDSSRLESAAQSLSRVFDVNPVVAKIRLGEIFPSVTTGQVAL